MSGDTVAAAEPRGSAAAITGSRTQVWGFWLALLLIVALGTGLRLGGLTWLIGVGESPGFSFHPDERAAEWASNIRAGSEDGYVLGMTTQVFLVSRVVKVFTSPDFVVIARAVSLFYAAATIVLVAVIARSWGYPRDVSLLAAAFLAVAPLHIVNSFFGTPDATAVFLFYLTLLTASLYLTTQRQLAFVLTAVLTGAALGVKFYVTAGVPLLLILAAQPRRKLLEQGLAAVMIVAGSFALASLFNFPPWKFQDLLTMLAFDNMVIAGGVSPLKQFGLYAWGSITALGIGLWILTVIGIVVLGRMYGPRVLGYLRQSVRQVGLRTSLSRLTKEPATLYAVAFVIHAALIVSAQIHVERHLLVFVPLACLIAARGVWHERAALRMRTGVIAAILAAVFVYQIQHAIAIDRLYARDVRYDVARWIASDLPAGATVGRFTRYQAVKGTQPVRREAAVNQFGYVVTCDLEYDRYFVADDATEIYHGAGQARLELFHALFAGETAFRLVRDFRAQPTGLEFRLIANGLLSELGTFVPRRCVAFGRTGGPEPGRVTRVRSNGW